MDDQIDRHDLKRTLFSLADKWIGDGTETICKLVAQ